MKGGTTEAQQDRSNEPFTKESLIYDVPKQNGFIYLQDETESKANRKQPMTETFNCL
jgi:hypothetical protein